MAVRGEYVKRGKPLRNRNNVAVAVILNGRPRLILNERSLSVRQSVGVTLPGGGEGAFQGPLGIALIGPLGAVP